MTYNTLADAQSAADQMMDDAFTALYGGLMILRALDGAGYGISWGTADMGDACTVYSQGYHHPAEIVETRVVG